MKRTTQIIEKHIDDVDFDIPVLCKEVGVGRSLLYAKFKALTGMTPNNFILNYRLQHAAMLLQKYPDLHNSVIILLKQAFFLLFTFLLQSAREYYFPPTYRYCPDVYRQFYRFIRTIFIVHSNTGLITLPCF